MIVTRSRLQAQEALVSTMQSHAAAEPDPAWSAAYAAAARRDEAKLHMMRQAFASTQRNNVFPLRVRGGVGEV